MEDIKAIDSIKSLDKRTELNSFSNRIRNITILNKTKVSKKFIKKNSSCNTFLISNKKFHDDYQDISWWLSRNFLMFIKKNKTTNVN